MTKVMIQDRIKKVEEEYGQGFISLITEYAEEGESKSAVAAILEIPYTTLMRWLKDHAPGIKWPRNGHSNAWKAAVPYRMNDKVRAAAVRNLARARELAPRLPTVVTDEVLERMKIARARGVSWRGMPKHLGMQCDWTNMRRAYSKKVLGRRLSKGRASRGDGR